VQGFINTFAFYYPFVGGDDDFVTGERFYDHIFKVEGKMANGEKAKG